ncbi:hypothetical protein BDR26DRAFT_1003084 [Obelidium mucronatum]|nr:hypothetical protein BDR26DRAFT_1003084 [Obelidium mucronatum]
MHLPILTLLLLAATVLAAKCTSPIIRREWSELSPDQKQQCPYYIIFVNSVALLAKRPISHQTRDASKMSYFDFVQTHVQNAIWTHGNAQFYPYHRALMFQFEVAMKSVGWNLGAVYWDWPAMSQNWWTSDVFQYFGASTSNDPDNCVLDGPFAKSVYTVFPGLNRPEGNPTCLRRCARINNALTDAVVITASLALASNYSSFQGDDTSNYHAAGHTTIGGPCGDLSNPMFSPNDPIFYLHHGLVDKVWWRWQKTCPSFQFSYDGFLRGPDDPIANGIDAQAHSTLSMDSWPWWTVADMLNTEGDTLCYTYSKSYGDLPILPVAGCPQSPSNNPLITNTQSASLPDTWMFQAMESLIQPSPSSSPKKKRNHDSQQLQPPLSNFSIPQPKPYTTTTHQDGSITIHFPDSAPEQNTTIPPFHKIHRVFESHTVQTINLKTNRPELFHPQLSQQQQQSELWLIPYHRLSCAAPHDLLSGVDPCLLVSPLRLEKEAVENAGLNWIKVQGVDNLVAMRVDAFNCWCHENYSPSQMKYHH